MSSHRLSVSGERQYTITAGGGSHTAAQMNAKPGDGFVATFGSIGEIVTVLPPSARIERLRNADGSEYIVLRVPGPMLQEDEPAVQGTVYLTLHGIPAIGQELAMPHTNVDVRKHDGRDPMEAFTKGYEVCETIELASPAKQVVVVRGKDVDSPTDLAEFEALGKRLSEANPDVIWVLQADSPDNCEAVGRFGPGDLQVTVCGPEQAERMAGLTK